MKLYKNLNKIDKYLLKAIRGKEVGGLTDYEAKDLLRASLKHGVFPYLYKNVCNSKENALSSEFITNIKKRNRSITEHTAKLVSELKNILFAFEQENIPLIILKGIYLSKLIYPEPNLRIFSDIDLLVRREDLSKATQCLESLGFEEVASNKELEEKEKRGQAHLAKSGVMIDLHWEIINDGLYRTTMNYKTDAIFDNCSMVSFLNNKILALNPIELVIYLGTHLATQHAFERLIWFNDLHCTIEKFGHKMNWDALVKIAKERLIATQIYYSLLFTKALLNSKVPQEAMEQLKPKYSLAKLFELSIKRSNIIELSRNRRKISFQIWLILRDNWPLSFKALLWRFFPSIEWFINYYSFLPRISPVYYKPVYPLLILIRLLVKPRMNAR